MWQTALSIAPAKKTVQVAQSRKGGRWDKLLSLGHILESGITRAVCWCSQNTLSSLQHLIKGLLIFSWGSQPSQHLAANTPLFLHQKTLSRNTQVVPTLHTCTLWTQQSFLQTSLCKNLRKEVLKKASQNERKPNYIERASVKGFYGWCVQEGGEADSQVQICGKNVPPHPCGELQLTLHLPTRR